MSDQFIAEIRIFPLNFAPTGWAQCDGQILSIAQNTALFSLLGTTYGGNGVNNFGLPNLQNSAPLHPGQGAGLSARSLGETGGEAAVTLLSLQMPNHSHSAQADATGGSNLVTSEIWASAGFGRPAVYAASDPPTNVQMSSGALATVGSNRSHNNLMPYLTLNFCIAMQGVFPPRG